MLWDNKNVNHVLSSRWDLDKFKKGPCYQSTAVL